MRKELIEGAIAGLLGFAAFIAILAWGLELHPY